MEYKNPGITADVIVTDFSKILLVKRKEPPYKGYWALPGGHIKYGKETLEDAAIRELKEETGIITGNKSLKLVGIFSDPKRSSNGHQISVAYLTNDFKGQISAGSDAKEARWFNISNLPKVAFDHKKMIDLAYKKYK